MSLMSRIRAMGLEKGEVDRCKKLDTNLLVDIAKDLGYASADGKSQGTLCRFILVKVASNPVRHKDAARKIKDAYEATANLGYARDCTLNCNDTRALRKIAQDLGLDKSIVTRANPEELCGFIFEQRISNPELYRAYAEPQLNECYESAHKSKKSNALVNAQNQLHAKLERRAHGGGYRN